MAFDDVSMMIFEFWTIVLAEFNCKTPPPKKKKIIFLWKWKMSGIMCSQVTIFQCFWNFVENQICSFIPHTKRKFVVIFWSKFSENTIKFCSICESNIVFQTIFRTKWVHLWLWKCQRKYEGKYSINFYSYPTIIGFNRPFLKVIFHGNDLFDKIIVVLFVVKKYILRHSLKIIKTGCFWTDVHLVLKRIQRYSIFPR